MESLQEELQETAKPQKLEEVCEIKIGKALHESDLDYTCSQEDVLSYKVVENISFGELEFKEEKVQLQDNQLNTSLKAVVNPGEIFIKKSSNSSAQWGSRVSINKESGEIICLFDIYKLKPKSSELIDAQWLFFYLLSKEKEIKTEDKLRSLELQIPSLEQQKEVSSNLLKLCNLQKILSNELELCDRRYHHYRNELIKDESIASEKCSLEELLSFSQTNPFGKQKDSNYEIKTEGIVIKNKNIQNGIILERKSEDEEIINPKLKYENVKKGEIVMVISGLNVGSIGINFSDKEYLLGQSLWKITPNKEKVLERYLYYFLLSSPNLIKKAVKTENRKHVIQNFLKSQEVQIPNLQNQKNIVEFLDLLIKSSSLGNMGQQAIHLQRERYKYYLNHWMNSPISEVSN